MKQKHWVSLPGTTHRKSHLLAKVQFPIYMYTVNHCLSVSSETFSYSIYEYNNKKKNIQVISEGSAIIYLNVSPTDRPTAFPESKSESRKRKGTGRGRLGRWREVGCFLFSRNIAS